MASLPTSNWLGRKAAIVGIGATEFSRNSGRSENQLAIECIRSAVEDAGLSLSDIDGVCNPTGDATGAHDIVNNFGLRNLNFFSEVAYGGGAPCGTVAQAAMAVATGQANYVVCYRALNEYSGSRYGQWFLGTEVTGDWAFEVGFGMLTAVHRIAMRARRHMHDYGTTSRQFGAITVACRHHANRNPRAQLHHRQITIEDHQSSRIISDPLHLLDCCLESDGGCAVVVTSLERARDLKQKPAVILAAAQAIGSELASMTNYNRARITENEDMQRLGETLFARAGVTPKDIDAIQIYDFFTPMVLMTLEDLGFCKKGEGGSFVEDPRRLQFDGELPLNTAGGQLGEAYIHGYNLLLEAVRQVRGTSTSQVADLELSMCVSASGVPSSGLILTHDG
jgi:acetyl-CoA acetyltransferase